MYTSNFLNLILNTDSYKASHWLQYPPNTEYISYYIEARGETLMCLRLVYKHLLKNIY